MYTYSLVQWMMFFFVYCFFGWCIESAIVSIQKRRFVNRGFLRIPMLPLYGFGAVLILFLTIPVKDKIQLVYIVGMIGATILEYLTGWAMEGLFKMKYWDYSNQRFQLHGRICLSSSLFWGVLSVALTEYIHPPIEHWILGLSHTAITVTVSITACVMLIDTVVSARAALDLAKVLEHLAAAKDEIEHIHTQIEDLKNAAQQQLGDLKENAQQQLEDIKEAKDTVQAQLKEHTEQLKERLSELTEQRESEMSHLGFLKQQLLKGHPSAYSQKFNTTLRELKEQLYKKNG